MFPLGKHFLFAYNVQVGLRAEIRLEDVFAVYEFRDDHTFHETDLSLLNNEKFSLSALIQYRFQVSLQSGREPSFPVEAGRRLLSIYMDAEEAKEKIRTLVMHLLDYDPERGESYRTLLLRLQK